jgi:hypothetical protein
MSFPCNIAAGAALVFAMEFAGVVAKLRKLVAPSIETMRQLLRRAKRSTPQPGTGYVIFRIAGLNKFNVFPAKTVFRRRTDWGQSTGSTSKLKPCDFTLTGPAFS